MDSNAWTRLYTSGRRHQSLSDAFQAEACEEEGEEEQQRVEFMCPFCAEDYDVVGLCCHIDEEHSFEANAGVCPVCAKKVGGSALVQHMTVQHGNLLKISSLHKEKFRFNFPFDRSFCFLDLNDHVQPRRRLLRRGIVSNNNNNLLLRRELTEGNLRSILGGPTRAEPDPALTSFIYNPPNNADDDRPLASVKVGPVEEDSTGGLGKKSSVLSDEDVKERARRCAFAQEIMLSTFLDDHL